MKNISKVLISLSLSITIFVPGTTVTAHDVIENNVEIIFNDNSAFTDAEKEIVKTSIIANQETIKPYGLQCTLFGHDYTTEYITVIRHKVSDAKPRCISEIYESKICENCSDTLSTLISSQVIDCCE